LTPWPRPAGREERAMTSRKQQLEETIRAARAALAALEAGDDQRAAEKLVGNCYVYRNCYSCPETEADYWNLYSRIVGAEDGLVVTVDFQVDKYGRVVLERNRRSHHSYEGDGYKPIPLSEFVRAWLALLDGPIESFGADAQKKIVTAKAGRVED